jgi:multicomponent Na+:H+ antiporter subunit D
MIFLIGALVIPVLKGRLRQTYLLLVPILGLIYLLFIKPATSWSYSFLNLTITPFFADRLSLFVGFIFILIGFLAILYSLHVEDIKHHLVGFLYIGSALGVVFAGDFLTLYIFWELLALTGAGLVLFGGKRESTEAAWRYLIMHLIGGVALFAGIVLKFVASGSLQVTALEPDLTAALILFGIGVNAAFVLIHTWLPDAYPKASFAGSVFLSVYTTKSAVYLLARLFPGWLFVAYMGATMAVFGVTLALLQYNGRKLLSYHIVSQVGYMVAAIGLGAGLGVNGGIFHLFNHILYKALLFMAIGALVYQLGKEDLTQLGGVGWKMPVTTMAAVVGALSISGTPLFNGFASKVMIFEAARAVMPVYLLLTLAAVGTFLSFFKFCYFGFLRPNEENEARATEAPKNMMVAMSLTAGICIAIGLYPRVVISYLPFKIPFEPYTFETTFGVDQMLVVTGALFFAVRHVFQPHRREIYDVDQLYITAARYVYSFANIISSLNQRLEQILSVIIPTFMRARQPIARLNELATRFAFALFVDAWLVQPVTPSVAEIFQTEESVRKGMEERVELLQRTKSKLVPKSALDLFDKITSGFACIGKKVSARIDLLDREVVDRFMRGLGVSFVKLGDNLKLMQSGQVQSYGLLMAVAAIILIFWTFGYLNIF